MDDLVKRLRDINTNYELARGIHCDISEAAARIEALEARIAKADALADALRRTGYRVDHNGVTTLTGIDAMIPINEALAAYREGSVT